MKRMYNIKITVFFFFFFFLFSFSAMAKSLLIEKCKLLKEIFPKMRIDKILPGPIPNLCEIWTGNNIIYYAPDKKLLFFGEIWDVKGHSLTQASRDKLLANKINKLPLNKAIKYGEGKVKVILFTDPDCPFCRRVESLLFGPLFDKKITVYTFLVPLPIHPHAHEHALLALCSKNPVQKLLAFIKNTDTVSIINKRCKIQAEKKLQEMQKSANLIGLRGTPLIIVGKTIIRGAQINKIIQAINLELLKDRREGDEKN